MQIEISIILPSHNGCDTLGPCLDALGKVTLSDAEFEVLLIDNASDDATPDILREHALNNDWQVISEPRRGKSFALNTGIEMASGQLVIFMDDDILPDQNWLQAYLDASRAFPEADIFAGQLRPKWPGRVPAWLQGLSDDGRCCGCTALGWPAGPYPAVLVKGGNVMFRRKAIRAARFDTVTNNFDGTAQAVGGEDTRFAKQLSDAGSQIVFVPDACARHIIQLHETRLSALIQRQVRIGRSDANTIGAGVIEKLFTFPAIGAYALAFGGLMLVGKRKHAIKQLLKIAMRFGRIEKWYLRRG